MSYPDWLRNMTPYAMNSCMHLMKERKRVEREDDGRRGEAGKRRKERGEETGGQRVTATYFPIRKTTFCH